MVARCEGSAGERQEGNRSPSRLPASPGCSAPWVLSPPRPRVTQPGVVRPTFTAPVPPVKPGAGTAKPGAAEVSPSIHRVGSAGGRGLPRAHSGAALEGKGSGHPVTSALPSADFPADAVPTLRLSVVPDFPHSNCREESLSSVASGLLILRLPRCQRGCWPKGCPEAPHPEEARGWSSHSALGAPVPAWNFGEIATEQPALRHSRASQPRTPNLHMQLLF
ncbi:hypothetical protein P7K49_024800 [Saguinus oedipus]|uniref:Uncharacterized protein n=1 Tax=Saguinus oedipus TaxID=9490 RepID=A0ABQ9UQJ2_SAGOE|nr:hypothetical protein P7K49_024800 [Saguinus oedipus]